MRSKALTILRIALGVLEILGMNDAYWIFVVTFLHQVQNVLFVFALDFFRLGYVSLAITDVFLHLAKYQVMIVAFVAQRGLASGKCLSARGELAHIIIAY